MVVADWKAVQYRTVCDMPPSTNPFHVPADEEVFALRDDEAQRKRIQREEAKKLHVWEKGVKTNTSVLMVELGKNDTSAQQSKLPIIAAAARDRRKEKEHMGEFIAKKREMFLVQMSLDTKRAEIRKLEERAQQREEVMRIHLLNCHACPLMWSSRRRKMWYAGHCVPCDKMHSC